MLKHVYTVVISVTHTPSIGGRNRLYTGSLPAIVVQNTISRAFLAPFEKSACLLITAAIIIAEFIYYSLQRLEKAVVENQNTVANNTASNTRPIDAIYHAAIMYTQHFEC
jgi:hypothetical protein